MEDDEIRDSDEILDYGDDDDFEYDEDGEIILEDEGMLSPGATVYSLGWILATVVADIAHAHTRFWDNLRTDLAYRHNRSIDESDFIGSVEAGIEKL